MQLQRPFRASTEGLMNKQRVLHENAPTRAISARDGRSDSVDAALSAAATALSNDLMRTSVVAVLWSSFQSRPRRPIHLIRCRLAASCDS